MKLYYAPGACSLADHITLHEAGLPFEHERVDLKSGTTEHGKDWAAISPKGYVPALRLDDGTVLTENVAVLDWLSQQSEALRAEGAMGRSRQLEALAYISSELHKTYKPFFSGSSDEEKRAAGEEVTRRLAYLAERMAGDYLLGPEPTVADFYLFVMLLWATKFGVAVPDSLPALRDRLMERPSVRAAMEHEGLR